jgi:hypothetical protein
VRGGFLSEYKLFSSDLATAVLEPEGATPLSPATSEWSPYRREASGEYLPLVTGCPAEGQPCAPSVMEHADVLPGTKFGPNEPLGMRQAGAGVTIVNATPDLSHIVLDAQGQLTAAPDPGNRYEWSGGQLQPLSVLPAGEGGSAVDAPAVSLSNDGSVFFAYGGHLYLRDFAKGGSGESLRLDVAEGVKEPAGAGAEFLYAGGEISRGEHGAEYSGGDGSLVLFSDPQQLTAAPGGGIYACHIVEAAGSLRCELELTGLSDSGELLLGGSEDASYLYFLGAEEKLYVDHYDGRGWKTTGGPSVSGIFSVSNGSQEEQLERFRPFRVSPNGQYLAFMSNASLTGYDNRDAVSGEPDQEVYEYQAVPNHLMCVSCNPTGARPVGMLDHSEVENGIVYSEPLVDHEGLWDGQWLAGSILGKTPVGGGSPALHQSRYLNDSGRLFFNSPVGLVPQDANGQEDVYEFEPEGDGSCESSTSTGTQVYVGEVSGSQVHGCLGLISSGTSGEESAFLDASGKGPEGEEGEEVFFMTASQLAPQDADSALDIYDAHSCSAASPCPPAAVSVPPACTTAESCRVAPPPQPTIFGAPSSETFSGAGNITPAGAESKITKKAIHCAKGRKLSHGKCVKRKQKKKQPKRAKKAGHNRRAK